MNKKIALSALLIVCLLGGWIILQKRAALAPAPQGQPTSAQPASATSSLTTTTNTKTTVAIQDRTGTRRMVEVNDQTGLAPLPALKILRTSDGFQVLEPVTAAQANAVLFALDTKTLALAKTPVAPGLLIGQAGTELVSFVSTRYAKDSYRTELNEIRAYDLKTRQERTLDTLAASFSYAKSVEGPSRSPRGTASVKDGKIRAEVYFEGTHLFPGQERLPIEIHTIPLATSTTQMPN